jgi:uncharacterized Zn-finger protein
LNELNNLSATEVLRVNTNPRVDCLSCSIFSHESKEKVILSQDVKSEPIQFDNNFPLVKEEEIDIETNPINITPEKQLSNVHKCELCNASFAAATLLREHGRQLHNGRIREAAYQCDICDKRFTVGSLHMKI